jgi:hypothetical protein
MAKARIGNQIIAEVQAIASSAKPAIDGVAQHFVGVIQNRLSSGQGSTIGWSGYASSYSEKYSKRKGRSKSPVYLIDSGEMLKSIRVLGGGQVRSAPLGRGSKLRGDLGQFIRAEDASVAIGLPEGRNSDLARIHTSGIYSKRGAPKPRPFMGLTVQEADQVARMVGRRLYQSSGTTESLTLNVSFG